MAISASISLVQSSLQFNQQGSANITASNSGMSSVTIQSFKTLIQPASAPNYESSGLFKASSLPEGFAAPITIPASGSVTFPISYVIFSPQVATSSSALASPQQSYTVGCYFMTSDGSLTSVTPASLTVTPLPLPASEL